MFIYVTLSDNDVYIIRSETPILVPISFFDSYGAFLISQHKNIDKIILKNPLIDEMSEQIVLKNLLIDKINFRKYVNGAFLIDIIDDSFLEYVDCVMS